MAFGGAASRRVSGGRGRGRRGGAAFVAIAFVAALGVAPAAAGAAPSASHRVVPRAAPEVTPHVATGMLRVTTSPALPAQILVDGVLTDSWGLTWVHLAAGSHTVSATHVEGYTDPAPQTVTVNANATTTVTMTFVRRGSLRVITSPALPATISVDGVPRDDWGMWTDLPAGSHSVCFGAVAGYTPPACQTATVTAGALTTVTGTFTASAGAPGPTQGMLRVTTSPSVPAQILVDGVLRDSSALTWLHLAAGSHTVSATHIEGFSDPAPQTVTVADGATTTVALTYPRRGSLRVMTSPALPSTITVDGVARDDWGMWTDLPTGGHAVCFGAVAGYQTPACQDATLTAGALTTITATFAPAGTTSLSFVSDPGDYIGSGQTRTWTPADGGFTLSGSGAHVSIAFSGAAATWWYLDFASPTGRQLIPGPFEGATRYPFQSPNKPGLDVSGSGRGCNESTGRFDILQLETDLSGNITRFAADFEQHCEGATPALRGRIQWNAAEPFPGPTDTDHDGVPDTIDNCTTVFNASQADADHDGVGDACDTVFNRTSITFQSDAADYIGGGITHTWYPVDGPIVPDDNGNLASALFRFYGGLTDWDLSFQAGSGNLVPGVYNGATRYPFQATGVPGLDVGGSGRGCNTLTGTFTILEIARNPDGTIARFSATFEQHCEGAVAALRGSIKYNASA